MKIYLGSDHAGYNLKEKVKEHLTKKQIEFVDLGTNNIASVDYPDYAKKVAIKVSESNNDIGILVCGTGIGVSIAANKVKGIRAALVYNTKTAKLARQHNNANIITLGERTTKPRKALKIVDAFLNETFEERHQKRIDKIKMIEKENENE